MLGAAVGTTLKMNSPRSALNDLGDAGGENMDTNWSDNGGGVETVAKVIVTVYSNGQVSVYQWTSFTTNTYNWHPSAPTTGIGNQYAVRFTRTSNSLTAEASSSASTGWLPLTTDRAITVEINDTDFSYDEQALCNYTLEIAAFGGFPIYETHNLVLEAVSM